MKYQDKLILRILIIFLVFLLYDHSYLLFSQLTKYLGYLSLNLFGYGVNLINNNLIVNNQTFALISACIALPAYYLLFFLILITKDIKSKDSVKIFLVGSLLILLMNVIRIDLLIMSFIHLGKNFFDSIHLIFWKFVSGIYVALVWIFLSKKYKIKNIPVYSDLKYLYSKSLLKKRK